MKKGIDVSVWNGIIDWGKVKPQIDYAIIRSGYGRELDQEDRYFARNYDECIKNGIPVGSYWYNYAVTPEDAENEARTCLKILNGRKFDYPIWYDIEESGTINKGKNCVSQIADRFCSILAEAGYKVGIYSTYYCTYNCLTDEIRNKYDLWVAHVGNNGAARESTPSTMHKMWQYSWVGKYDGINGNVDEDYCYYDYLTINTEQVVEEIKEESIEEPEDIKEPEDTELINITYSAYTKKWLNEIVNCEDNTSMGYAGIENTTISGLIAKADKGLLEYRVHARGGKWYNWISKYNRNNWKDGVAGYPNILIDGIQFNLKNCPGYQVKYRVSINGNNDWLPWVVGLEDYAGLYGRTIDKIQAKIIKI